MLHTEAGSESGTEAEFGNAASQVSAHVGVALDGTGDQFVQLGDRAWANGILEPGNRWGEVYAGPTGPDAESGLIQNPNNWTVAIETEDGATPERPPLPVTDAQYASVLAVGRLVLATYPSVRWLLGHYAISPQTRPNCPGDRWVASGRFAALAAALGLQTL